MTSDQDIFQAAQIVAAKEDVALPIGLNAEGWIRIAGSLQRLGFVLDDPELAEVARRALEIRARKDQLLQFARAT